MKPQRVSNRDQRLLRRGHAPRCRDGYTLTELLIVITIMIILMVITLPVARKVMESTQTREASRQLNSFLAMAQARAAQSGRPAGLFFKLDTPLGVVDPTPPTGTYVRQATQMYLAEVPPPYAGSTLGARAQIYSNAGVYEFAPVTGTDIVDTAELAYMRSIIDPGEMFVVRFDFKGPWYRCKRGIATDATYTDPNRLYYTGLTTTGTSYPQPPGYSTGLSYAAARSFQILRSPRRVGSPLELTSGTCVDMVYSGIGLRGNEFSAAQAGVAVMFLPSGGIDSVWIDRAPPAGALQGSLHFLIGKVEKMNAISPTTFTDPEQSNLADHNNFWVSINRQGGGITTAENLFDTSLVSATAPETPEQAHIRQARRAATSREQMGGR